MLGGERVERQDVVLGVLEQRGELWQPGPRMRDGVAEAPTGLAGVGCREELTDHGAERVVLVPASVAAEVS